MKFNIDIECTPEEARHFLGLPDVAPLQQATMDEIQRRMTAGLESMDADTLMKTWLPAGLQGMDQLQKMFWSQMNTAAGGAKAGSAGSGKKK